MPRDARSMVCMTKLVGTVASWTCFERARHENVVSPGHDRASFKNFDKQGTELVAVSSFILQTKITKAKANHLCRLVFWVEQRWRC